MRCFAVHVLTVALVVAPLLAAAQTQNPAALKLACGGGDAKSCFDLGVLHESGKGVPKDKAKAAELYKKACDAGSASGCFALGLMYKWGKGVAQNKTKASELYMKACETGLTIACDTLKREARPKK
jgi:TPR repeat protein